MFQFQLAQGDWAQMEEEAWPGPRKNVEERWQVGTALERWEVLHQNRWTSLTPLFGDANIMFSPCSNFQVHNFSFFLGWLNALWFA